MTERNRMAAHLRSAMALVFTAAAVLAAWQLSYVLLLAFAALIVAAILHGTKDLVERFTPLKSAMAMLAAIVVLAIGIVGFLAVLGHQIYEQLQDLIEDLPELIDRAADALGVVDVWAALEAAAGMVDPGSFAGGLGAGVLGVLGTLGAIVVIAVGGVYFATEPNLYRRGIVALFPSRHQPRITDAIDTSADTLKRWLAGQLIAMLVIGTATTIALLALGLPSALAIGFIAGVLEFIPFVGPILAAIPALLVALAEGEQMLIWVTIIYVLIQQIEGNVLVPLIQKRTVRLPPALGLFSILAFGIAFGPWGFILATPLTVVLMVLVQKLYLKKDTDQTG